MDFCKQLGKGIKIMDFFYSTQIIRYNNEPQYKTLTGGLISLIIIVATTIGFSNRIKILFEKTQIYSSFEVNTVADPPFIDLMPGKNNFLMVFIVLDYATSIPINLNNGPQIFNIFESKLSFQKGVPQQNIYQQLGEPCTLQHLEKIDISDSTYKQTFKTMYPFAKCLKLNESYSIGGQMSSSRYKLIRFQLKQCLNTTVNNNKCASKSQIDIQLSQSNKFQFVLSYLNPIINPTRPSHIEYYANVESSFILSNTFGQMTTLKLQDFAITTDTSILPFETYIEEKGFLIEERSIIQPYEKSSINTPFVIIRMIKSSRSLVYNRSYLKLSTIISYIGGLVGGIVAVMFIIKFYTNCSLQINISLDLFHKTSLQNQQSRAKKKPTFNFYSFVCLYFYKLLKKIKKCGGFKQSKRLQQFQKQINYHLDIKFLLRRIFKIQQFLIQSLAKDEINLMQGKISIQRAIYLRNLLNYTKKGESESESDKKVGFTKAERFFSSRQLVEIEQKGNDRENNNNSDKNIGLEIILKTTGGYKNKQQQNPNSKYELKRQGQGLHQNQRNNHQLSNKLEYKQSKPSAYSLGLQEK